MDFKSVINQFEDKDDVSFKKNILMISSGIAEGKSTILELIENLDLLLTNDHASKRELGTSVLTEVLQNISSEILDQQQLEVLADFYASKLSDHHQILPAALSGVLTLIQFKHFPGGKVPTLLNSIFKNVPCQQQQRADRYTIFQVFEYSLRVFKAEILEMKLEFVYIVLTSVDAERDPRNLLFLFKWMKVFLGCVALHHLTEDMFDVLACYFPVDFRAPPNETTITREALAEALSPCLCAIPEFGDSCISLALEKLESSLEIAKKDSLQLLIEGCLIFPTSIYVEKASEIWSLLQKEVFTNNSEEIRLHCLTALFHIISKLSEDTTGVYEDILQNIFDNLKGNLLPDSKLFEKSSQILSVVGSTKCACRYIIKQVVPLLTNIYTMTAYNDQRAIIVKTLVEFVKVHLKHNEHLIVEDVPELLNIPTMCLEILNVGDDSRKIGFECLQTLMPYLTPEVKLKLYSSLQSSIFIQDKPEIRTSFLACLTVATIHNPNEVRTQIFTTPVAQPSAVDCVLNSMTPLVSVPGFQNFAIDYYLQTIKNLDLSKIAIRNTKQLIEKEQQNIPLLKKLLENRLLDTLIDLVLVNNCSDIAVLRDVSRISKLLISPQSSDLQLKIYEKYYDIIYKKILDNDFNLIVMDGLICALRKDIQVNYELLDVCYNCSTVSHHDVVRDVASKLLANLINKMNDDENLVQFLLKLNEKCAANILIQRKNTIITSSCITKGLLMRNHRHGLIWLDWLVHLLETLEGVPEAFRIIMNDDCDSLSLDVHCNKISLYRQKTFLYVTNKIIERYDQNKNEYLTAFGYILEFTPLQAILLQFARISRYIILSLEKNQEPQVLFVILSIVNTICSNNSALIEPYLEDYVNRILKLCGFEPSMKVRIGAIQCLKVFTRAFPLYKLLPLKSTVLHKLGTCVDDRKRLVRKEAMEARSLWFLLDAPL